MVRLSLEKIQLQSSHGDQATFQRAKCFERVDDRDGKSDSDFNKSWNDEELDSLLRHS